MISRRTFLKFSSAGALTLYTLNKFGVEEAVAAIPGGTLPVPAAPLQGFDNDLPFQLRQPLRPGRR